MREILFRGQNKYCSSWIVGYYYEKNGIVKIKNDYQDLEIDAETVGQYTGLCDKNGTKIFEGDILSCQVYTNIDERENYSVYFDNGMFFFKDPKEPMSIILIENVKFFDCEVIGNIYDNYELLEE